MDNQPQPFAFESVRDVLARLTNYLPTLFAGIVVLLVGVVVAWIVAKLTVRILVFLRLDRVLTRMGWGRALEKGDVRHSLFGLLGTVAGVLLFLVFLENAVVIWKLTVLSKLLESLVLLIPQLIAAVIIVLAGWGLAAGVSRAVQRNLVQEEFERARLTGRIVLRGHSCVGGRDRPGGTQHRRCDCLRRISDRLRHARSGSGSGLRLGQQTRRRTDVGGALPSPQGGTRAGSGGIGRKIDPLPCLKAVKVPGCSA